MNLTPVLIALVNTLATHGPTWPTAAPLDRAYLCGDSRPASPPVGFAARLQDEIRRVMESGLDSRERALRKVAATAGCGMPDEAYGVNWPASEPGDNRYLCSDHRRNAPHGYSQRLHAALVSRVELGMSLAQAADDIRALGGCPDARPSS